MAGTRTSELEAINTMLSSVGEPPINSLDDQKNADAAIAGNILTEISREVQTQGWHFNSQRDITLSPDSTTNFIAVTSDVVRVDLYQGSSYDNRDITQRGSKLFDKKNNTYEFSSSVKVDIIYVLSWDDMPEPALRYIVVRAARIFQDRMVGSQAHHAFTMQDEYRTLADLKEWEGDSADHTIFDNYDTYRTVNRGNSVR